MTQSDSPDFEFDISDLEVERADAAPSMEGAGVPVSESEPVGEVDAQASEGEELKRDSRADFDDADRELDVFEIDDLPDSSPPEVESEKSSAEPEGSEIGSSADADPEPVEVSRIEEKPDPVASRVLGADDLGADVFAEIETELGSMGLDDVIDGLMDEVEDFEAGGFVELDEEDASTGGTGRDEVFKMADPDDSLGKSVDPNAVDEEPFQAPAAFPSPPVDFEIPADPEPAVPQAVVGEESNPSLEEEPQVSPPVKEARNPASAPAFEEEGSSSSAPAPVDSEIPADPPPPALANPVSSSPAKSADEEAPADVSAVSEEVPGNVEEDVPSAELDVESEGIEESAPPVEGHERVMFSAEDEELESAASDETVDMQGEAEGEPGLESVQSEGVGESESAETALPEDEPEILNEGLSPEPQLNSLDAAEEEGDGEVDAILDALEEEEAAESVPELLEVEEEEEDLADLLGAVSDEADVEEFGEDGESEPAAASVESDSVVSGGSMGAAVPELAEVEEEEEDISELLDSVGEEDDSSEGIPGLEILDDDEGPESVASDLDDLDDADEELVHLPSAQDLSAEAAPEESPGLIVEDEEEGAAPPSVPDLVEVPEEGEESPAAEVSRVPAALTAEELLMRASGLLNGDSSKPVDGASAILDEIDGDDEEEIIEMPSPEAMIADASFADDDEVISLPDPMSLMTQDGEAIAVIDDDDEEEVPVLGNVADRGGDLPPPPPAPVEILDEEPPEEDLLGPEPEAEVDAFLGNAEDEGAGLEDPFAGEISLDDFQDGLGELAGSEDDDAAPLDEDAPLGDEPVGDAPAAVAAKKAEAPVAAIPKPSLLWRVTHSMGIAAGLVLVGLTGIFAVWKQEIVEFYEGRDIDGSFLLHQIQTIGTHALGDFDEHGLYRMQWVDSEVRRMSENEIRLHALVGAQLKENLYKPVLESELFERKSYDDQELVDRLTYARDHFPEEIANYPDKPWNRLFEISASKDQVLPLRVTYSITRENAESDWELGRIKVSGYKGDLEWPEGEPAFSFGEKAYDVDSREFQSVYGSYLAASGEYIARVDRLRSKVEDSRLALQRDNELQRERVKMALAEGSYFRGLAIVGEDGVSSRDVKLVITEVRSEGDFVKGVVTMEENKVERTKHFVGSLVFEKTLSGKEQGFLSLRTISIDAPVTAASESPFFETNNVSQLRLRADGFRLEGDSRDLSFRLTRSL